MTPDRNLWARQLLQRGESVTVEEAVERCGGLYSTAPTSYLSLAARIPGFHRSQLDRALIEDRSLVRLSTLRGSAFLVPVDMVDDVLSAADREPWYRRTVENQVGKPKAKSWRRRILSFLVDGPLPARVIRAQLGVAGREAEALRYLLSAMTLERDLAVATPRAGWRNNQYEYALWGPVVS